MKLLAVCDDFHHFDAAIREYMKRLPGLEIQCIKPEKSTDPKRIIEKESERIFEYLSKQKGYVLYLDILGKPLSTETLVEKITKLEDCGEKIIFLIGWAYGIDMIKLKPHIRESLSLSPMTFPHGLAFLILLEQLYRVHSIQKGSKYHH